MIKFFTKKKSQTSIFPKANIRIIKIWENKKVIGKFIHVSDHNGDFYKKITDRKPK